MAKVIPIGGMTCMECDGRGLIIIDENGFNSITNCLTCDGKGWVLEQDEDNGQQGFC